MDEAAVTAFISGTFEGVETTTAYGATFFSCDPERKFPFATITTSDENDPFSDLNRPGVFRLNIGVSKPTFLSLFPSHEGHDFTALDRLMPHPVYGKMYWVCVLSPTAATFDSVKPLLAEAHAVAKRKAPGR